MNIIKNHLRIWAYDNIINTAIEEAVNRGLEEGLAKGLELGRAKGLQEGLEEGHQKGLAKGKLETARNLLTLGVDINIISKATGLDLTEVQTMM